MPPHLDCRAAMRQLWDFLDQELTADRMEAMRAHLESCRPCQSHVDFERAFLDAVARVRQERPVSPDLRTRVMEVLKREGFIESGSAGTGNGKRGTGNADD